MKRYAKILALIVAVLAAAVCGEFWVHRGTPLGLAHKYTKPLNPTELAVVAGARGELSWGTGYDARYLRIAYPGGDVPRKMGACTDVVIRAYRNAGIDLQRLIHEDMLKAWGNYPRYHGLAAPDTNIDHRRVPNQAVFYKRHWQTLTTNPSHPGDWVPGDVVQWKLGGRYYHTGILCDDLDTDGFPMVIHNMGDGPQEQDVLRSLGWTITGHFRYPAPRPPKPKAAPSQRAVL